MFTFAFSEGQTPEAEIAPANKKLVKQVKQQVEGQAGGVQDVAQVTKVIDAGTGDGWFFTTVTTTN
jgi:arabinogalactan endo-1,4-beta-galactosidase